MRETPAAWRHPRHCPRPGNTLRPHLQRSHGAAAAGSSRCWRQRVQRVAPTGSGAPHIPASPGHSGAALVSIFAWSRGEAPADSCPRHRRHVWPACGTGLRHMAHSGVAGGSICRCRSADPRGSNTSVSLQLGHRPSPRASGIPHSCDRPGHSDPLGTISARATDRPEGRIGGSKIPPSPLHESITCLLRIDALPHDATAPTRPARHDPPQATSRKIGHPFRLLPAAAIRR